MNDHNNITIIYVGADHRGFELRHEIIGILETEGMAYNDLGNMIYDDQDDYPDYASQVAEYVAHNPQALGILICGSGQGMCITANKFDGVRASVCHSGYEVAKARSHDHINILCLSADSIDRLELVHIVKSFISTYPSRQERHLRRVDKIRAIEQNN